MEAVKEQDTTLELEHDAEGHATTTPANVAVAFRMLAATLRRAHDNKGKQVETHFDAMALYVIAFKRGWITTEQARESVRLWGVEGKSNEGAAQHFERLADIVEQAKPTDTVPQPTSQPSRTEVAEKFREFARRARALTDASARIALAFESGNYTYDVVTPLGYSDDNTQLALASQAAEAFPGRDNQEQYPYLMDLIANAIEKGGATPGLRSNGSFTPEQQFVAGRAFGAQPHRFGSEVM